jgi:hypothetical protein
MQRVKWIIGGVLGTAVTFAFVSITMFPIFILVAAFATLFFRFLALPLIVIFSFPGKRGTRLFKKTLTEPTARGKEIINLPL